MVRFPVDPTASQGTDEVQSMVLARQKFLQLPAGNKIARRVEVVGRLERHVVGNFHRPGLDSGLKAPVDRVPGLGHLTATKS